MASRLLPFTFPSARPLACALLLVAPLVAQQASAQDPPNGLPYKGMLQLRLGGTNSVTYNGIGVGGAPTVPAQAITPWRRNDCRIEQPSAKRLLDFSATQGTASAPIGLVSGSMGVFSGSQGTPCSRFSTGSSHELTVALGPDITSLITDAAFYRLELDIEAKANLAVELQVLRNGAVTDRYLMRTGSSIAGYEPGTSIPAERIFDCQAPRASDSGPDAGALDNCTWTVDELGHGFRLVPRVGEGSLEGGADTGVVTKIFLTSAVIGALGCGERDDSNVQIGETSRTIGDGVNEAQCTVTRIDPTPFGGQCTQAVGYVFRNLGGGVGGCELVKSPGEQLAASIRIKFPREISTSLGAPNRTQIEFSDGQGDFVPYEPDRCVGSVERDANGTRTIVEVLQPDGFGPAVDVVRKGDATDPIIDWACILDNEEHYLGPPAGQDEPYEMQVTQTILFWGDIRFSRE